MPELERPDGARIHWSERGEGPLVVIALQFFGLPSVFEALISNLAEDHRVVTYDIRGTGDSTPSGPYDFETDADDLIALIELLGEPAVIVAVGDGPNRAVRAGAARPELVRAIVAPGGNPVGRVAAEGTDALVASQSVLDAIREQAATDYRGALRGMFSSANPQMSDPEVRDRVQMVVEYCPQAVGVARLDNWIRDEAADASRAVGGKLWLLEHGTNPWFPLEIMPRAKKLLPDAHIDEVEDGPLSRPDIAAGYVRRITVGESAAVSQDR
jgi:pimeloyl-ACP methyl ester carboxylesterase